MAAMLGAPPSSAYRNGDMMAVPRGATLPAYCVKCGQPGDGPPIAKTFMWHPAWVFVTVLVSPLIYVIIAMIVRKKFPLEVTLCQEHRSRRQTFLWIGMALLLGCVPAAIVLGGVVGGDAGVGVGILVFMGGLIGGVIVLGPGRAMLTPKFVDDTRATFGGAGDIFLNMLPPGPAGP